MVLVSGVAGLAAGAFAMAAGEYVSVRSQRELFEHQISLERDELKQYPEAEAQELALIYAAKGLPQREATKLAKQIVADPEHALDTLAREELGLNPGELGSPVRRGGELVPRVRRGCRAAARAVRVRERQSRAPGQRRRDTAVALFAIGATLSLFTGRSAWVSGARMLALGALAGARDLRRSDGCSVSRSADARARHRLSC